eukprot:11036256-Karenia_brevis.AAC.1
MDGTAHNTDGHVSDEDGASKNVDNPWASMVDSNAINGFKAAKVPISEACRVLTLGPSRGSNDDNPWVNLAGKLPGNDGSNVTDGAGDNGDNIDNGNNGDNGDNNGA